MGLDLRSQESLIFQNLTSAVPIYAAQEQLHDRDQLLRLLNDQMRERLAVGTDLGGSPHHCDLQPASPLH